MPKLIAPSEIKNGNVQPLAKRNELVRTETEKTLDHLTQLWDAVEAKILKMQPPRHIQHTYNSGFFEDCGVSWWESLGLQRHGNKWRVCHGSGNDVHETMTWRPINDCSTEVRVEAAKYIDGLMEEVVKSGKEFIPEIKKAIESLENALADI